MSNLRKHLNEALSILLPSKCVGCGLIDERFCESCRSQFHPPGWSAGVSSQTLIGNVNAFSKLSYSNSIANAIRAFKIEGSRFLAREFSDALIGAIHVASSSVTYQGHGLGASQVRTELAPVPSNLWADRIRGFNPICRMLQIAGLEYSRVLSCRNKRSQKTLNTQEREKNLIGAFKAKENLAGRKFIVIDDVVTTGSTLREAVRAIERGGGEVFACATLATTPKLIADFEASRDFHRQEYYGDRKRRLDPPGPAWRNSPEQVGEHGNLS